MNQKAIIRLEHLSTGYVGKHKTRVIASNVNASLYSGQLTCLLGANGAGKSTLLRTLCALQPALSGNTYIQDKLLSEYTDKQLAKTISVVLTERFDLRNMSVIELTGMGRSPYTGFWGKLSKEDLEIVEECLQLVGIESLKKRMVHTLSDGERQKVMIAKALAQKTPVIFLDEPTAFLDYPSKVEIMQLLHTLAHDYGKTIFLSTHDLELALQIADKLWLMDKEQGLRIGIPEDLSLDGSLEKFFSKKGIFFDYQSGLFKVVPPNVFKRIYLSGEDAPYQMVKKALSRIGIFADAQVESTDSIVCEPSAYTYITSSGKKEVLSNIEALLGRIMDEAGCPNDKG